MDYSDDFKCGLKIPWDAHEVGASGDTLLYIVNGSVVCAHKVVLVKCCCHDEKELYYGAGELGPPKYLNTHPDDDVDKAEIETTRSPFLTGGCRCNETDADGPEKPIFKCSECGSRLGSPHNEKCAYL